MPAGLALKTPYQIRSMDAGAAALVQLFAYLGDQVAVGQTGLGLESLARDWLGQAGYTSLLLGYRGFPASICVNINDCAAHGVPNRQVLQEGDVVTVDVAVAKQGFCSDMAWTWVVGPGAPEAQRLMMAAWQAAWDGALASAEGLGGIARAVDAVARRHGYLVLTQFAGHGLGRNLHEAPKITYGVPGLDGPIDSKPLEVGTVFTVEPILVGARDPIDRVVGTLRRDSGGYHLPPNMMAAQFELMVAMEARGPRVLGFSDQRPTGTPQYKPHSAPLSR